MIKAKKFKVVRNRFEFTMSHAPQSADTPEMKRVKKRFDKKKKHSIWQ
jgi:hypothetical protein